MTMAEARGQCGWSQVQLAREADISPGYVSDIESGRRRPSLAAALALAKALGRSTDELFPQFTGALRGRTVPAGPGA